MPTTSRKYTLSDALSGCFVPDRVQSKVQQLEVI